MPVLDLTKNKIMFQGNQINKVYHKSQLVYHYELKDVQIGNDVITEPANTVTRNNSSINEWESYTEYGDKGITRTLETAHFINNTQIGAGYNRRVVVVSVPSDNIFHIGTKSNATHRKAPTPQMASIGASDTYAERIRATFDNLYFSNGSRVIVSFRVTNGGINVPRLDMQLALKQRGYNITSTYRGLSTVNRTNLDNNNNPLHTIQRTFTNTRDASYGEYVILSFVTLIDGIHDFNMYIEGVSEPIYYIVVYGDTWWGIWNRERIDPNTTREQMHEWNNSSDSTPIYPGDKIIVGWT